MRAGEEKGWGKGQGDREGRVVMMFSCRAVLRVLLVLTGIGACCHGLGDKLRYKVGGE